ncbi:peptide deformylase [Sphingobacterium sp.]|jgi:peptide deformylase|uniref:peptide deformylase n=1 Tax=Sphingobacterium sp. TaxID=341027 RepID=UPI00289BE0DD|nr:peptide deformylase [Sphingobacterium sp.]
MKKTLIASFLLACCFNLHAQSNYEKQIVALREEKANELAKEQYGPLKADQVAFLDYFPVDANYKVKAKIEVLFDEPVFRMPTYDGTSNEYKRYGIITFILQGKERVLNVYQSVALFQNPAYKKHLFLPFLDLTNGQESYSGGRYIDLSTDDIKGDNVEIDFNKAYNPYCAYSNGYRCPVPPVENNLETKIMAGEKAFHKSKNERPVNLNAGQEFSAADKKIILSGDENALLRVLQTTDDKDLKVLKATSSDVKYNDPLLESLSKRMFATVRDPNHPGVGIAAPQIGINKNLIWVQRFDKAEQPFEFYINPKILWRSKLKRKGAEGCLSIPNRKEDVLRSYAIRLQYISKEGKVIEENIEGFTAVIFQHETDHLFGILFPDRLEEQSQEVYAPLNDKIEFSIQPKTLTP